ncbi:MAG TPA: imidazolonepropionase [Actinomycetota bacterium]|nr:imidazolonepropionase [Actinomycetota bacterium]
MARGAAVAATLATATGSLPARGVAAGAEVRSPGAVAWDEDGTIVFVGDPDDLPWEPVSLGRVDEGTIVPGFVDCHVHLPFVGWRADEFEARLSGQTYRDLHGLGGGIARSARMLAEADDDDVLAFSKALADEMAGHGTTALELKSGYGLSVEGELRQLRLARRLAQAVAQTCSVTILACHAVPEGITREDWVRIACDELVPTAAREGLADAVDVYVEDIAFSVEDLERVAAAASAADLSLRVHADQLGPSGAAEAAARLGARSADHLNHVSDAGVAALGSSDTVAVLLPASTFSLRAAPAPVAAIRDAGAALALGTDLNPGTSPIASMPEAIAFACSLYGITPLEALTAATANGAFVLGLDDRLGTLEVGKRADLLVLDGPTFAHVPYRPGHDPVVATVIAGEAVKVRS